MRNEKLEKLKTEAKGRGLSDGERDEFLRTRFYIDNPDPDFNPERNAEVVRRTMEKHEKVMAAKQHKYNQQVAHISDNAMAWIRHEMKGKNSTPLEEYIDDEVKVMLKANQMKSLHLANNLKKLVS